MTTPTAPVSLDSMAALVKQYDDAVEAAASWTDLASALKARIQREIGEATEATLEGAPAFTWKHTGKFNEKSFATTHPDLAAQYTHPVTRDELDETALKTAHPEAYTAHRGRRFERKA